MHELKLKFIKKLGNGAGLITALLFLGSVANAQVTVKGVVRDTVGGIPGATVKVAGTSTIVQSDPVGRFQINASATATLVFSFIGMQNREVPLAGLKRGPSGSIELDILMIANANSLTEVAITGFGSQQKKASLVSSITTVDLKDLKTPQSNLTNTLQGKVAGIIAFQQSGEPGIGTDNSTFYIRGLSTFGTGKRDPLILIDGIESTATDMARLQPDDISDFSVLKDAAASSIYGARGANGVVLINTKLGKEGAAKFYFRNENRISSNTKNFQLADNITYMTNANEAYLARNPLGIQPYTQNKINHTAAGDDPYLFPNNNWIDQLIKDYTVNQAYNLNINGGSARGRYFVSGTYNRDNGILKVDGRNDFNSNIKLNTYSLRSNIDLNVTKSTVLLIRMSALFDDYSGPNGGGGATFNNALRANPVMFPAVYPADKLPYIEHPLFGSARSIDINSVATNVLYINPYAEMVKGYQTTKNSNVNPQIEIRQDLGSLVEGLTGRVMSYVRRTSSVSLNRFYNPFFYNSTIDPATGSYHISVMNDGSSGSLGTVGTEYLNYNETNKSVDSRFWAEGSLNYSRVFGNKHSVGGMLVTYLSNYEVANPGSLILSLPSKNNGVSGRFSYGYDDRYLVEFNFGYNGSERFAENSRFGFFPSGGIAYRISEEKFFEPLKHIISNLKFRATYGIVGNDQIGAADQRFLYLSNVNLSDALYGASFGKNDGVSLYSRPGVSVSRYANNDITWEISKQLNLGMDLDAGPVNLIVDAFQQKRSRILQPRTFIDSSLGLMTIPFSNYGEAESRGVDLSLAYRKRFSKNFHMDFRGTFSFATSKFITVDELPYGADLAYLSKVGRSLGQTWGYIAERLFIDDQEAANSPVQFGDNTLRGGDIKYRDINGDQVINTDDMVPIGYPTTPEINFGFGSSMRYKSFDFSFYFTGIANSSLFMNSTAMSPFYQEGGYQTGLLKVIAENHWSERNPDIYALWPRLSTNRIASNNVVSTWWMRDGGLLRLKNLDFGYNFAIKKLKITNARIYASGTNLFVLSKFKLWDPEMGGNGLGYPLQSVYNLGISLNL